VRINSFRPESPAPPTLLWDAPVEKVELCRLYQRMIYLSIEKLGKQFPDKILFENLTFGISKGEKVALIANNGTGKSTLMKIIAGKDTPDSGEVYLRDTIKVGYLEQDPSFKGDFTIDELLNSAHTEVMAVIRQYDKTLADQSELHNEQTQKAFELATSNMDKFDAWDYERRMKQILDKFNILDLNQKISSLSGGQKKRLALGLALLDNPDLLILDEPTNHLDIDMIEWLEKYLSQSQVTLLMVTHDRYFLDRVCNLILELNDGKFYRHKGNYDYFLEKRAEREEVFKTEIEKAGKQMKRELQWMRRQPKARTTKSKSRIDNFYEIEKKAGSGKKVEELRLEVKMSRIGGKILELKKVHKSYGDIKIMDGFEHTFKKGERIGIIGKNGVGKTTFLNIITQKEQVDSGKVNVGETIVYGYYSQEGLKLKEDKRILDTLKDYAEMIEMGDGTKLTASQLLTQFQFPPEMQYKFVSKLSGGERRRLYLLTVLIKNPNFLILDEPTNDLDLLTLNKLEDFLENFGGCLVIVSHDRYFMDQLVDSLFVFEGEGKIREFLGTYSDYRDELEERERSEREQKTEAKKIDARREQEQTQEKKKLTYKERLEYAQLEKDIAALEKEKKELEATLHEGNSDYEALQKMSLRIGEIIQLSEAKTLRWMELAEFAE